MMKTAERNLDYIAKIERLNAAKNKDILQNWLDRIVKRDPQNPIDPLKESE